MTVFLLHVPYTYLRKSSCWLRETLCIPEQMELLHSWYDVNLVFEYTCRLLATDLGQDTDKVFHIT